MKAPFHGTSFSDTTSPSTPTVLWKEFLMRKAAQALYKGCLNRPARRGTHRAYCLLGIGAFLSFVLLPGIATADTTNFTGTWEMAPAKSQVADGRTVTLVIETLAATYTVTR